MNKYDPYLQFLATFSVSSFAGLAALLRSGEKLNFRVVASAMLNSGFLGLVIFMCWGGGGAAGNIWALMGISILAGLGGNTAIDFALSLFKSIVQAKYGIKDKEEKKDV